MAGNGDLKWWVREYQDALQEARILAGLVRGGYVEPVLRPDGQMGYNLTEKGWAQIASLPLPDDDGEW